MQYTILALGAVVALGLPCTLSAQFGGNGSNGAFVPDRNTLIDTRWNNGAFHFTKIAIPSHVTVTVRGPNPAFFFCQGTVVIDGRLDLSANGQLGGPGAGDGGDVGKDGTGPGAGKGSICTGLNSWTRGGHAGHKDKGADAQSASCTPSQGGLAYGGDFPIDVTAGSGGAGGSADSRYWTPPGPGGGGGGFLAIEAAGDIQVSGEIWANGSAPATVGIATIGGGGSGGKVLLRSLHGVSVTGQVRAEGGATGASDGFIRFDSYRSLPVFKTATVRPTPVAMQLMDLDRTTDPKIGTTLNLRVVSLADDTVLLAGALTGAYINFPPYGTLKLDPTTFFVFGFKKATGGIDGFTNFDVPIPNDPRFLGLMAHWQAINVATSASPLLTNLLITTIQ